MASDSIGFEEGVDISLCDASKGIVQLADGAGSLANPNEWAANPSANIARVKSAVNTVETLPAARPACPAVAAPSAPGMNSVPMVPTALPMNFDGSLSKLLAALFHRAPANCALPSGSAAQLTGLTRPAILPSVSTLVTVDLTRAMFALGLAAHSIGSAKDPAVFASCTRPLPAS